MTTLATTAHEGRFTMIKSTTIQSCLQEKWPDWFILSAGGILALTGAAQVLGFFQESAALDVADPIFGCPFRDSILIFGIVEVIAAMFCLFAKGGAWIAGIVAWVVANVVAYRVGLWSMGWYHPYTCLFYLLHALDITPATADGLLNILGGCLLTGSVAILLKSWFFRNASGFVKISCVSCGGHIEFPPHAVGQKIQCPHCAKTITLLKPA
jgi:ribosomal protein S27E